LPVPYMSQEAVSCYDSLNFGLCGLSCFGGLNVYAIGQEEIDAVARVIRFGKLFRHAPGADSESNQFELEWAQTIGVERALMVTSGTAALICGLAGMGVGPGDEVIVPAYTFMASAIAPLAVGAVPVIAEIDESLTLDPADAERKITPRTKAIMPVYMRGLPADLDAILEVARRHNVAVIEDACQAVGGSYKGKRLGSHGETGAFSFNYYKNISCGEGGAVVTDDETVYQRALIFHDGGAAFRSNAAEMKIPFFAGMNFRTNEILAAIMRVQLTRLDDILEALRAEKRFLVEELRDCAAFTLSPVRCVEGDCASSLALLFDSPKEAEAFVAALKELGVGAMSPINSGRHVYSNWSPILEKRGSHHERLNPYNYPDVKVEYAPDMCPRTLDILARTVDLSTSPTRSKDESAEVVKKVRQAAEKIGRVSAASGA